MIKQTTTLSEEITQHKQTEDELRVSNERFRASFADATIGMALISLEHVIIQANQSFCNMLGYSRDKLNGVFLRAITHPDDVENSIRHHKMLIDGEIDNYHFEKRYLHKQGHYIWGILNVSLVRDKDAMPIYSIAQIQDITERKQAEVVIDAIYAGTAKVTGEKYFNELVRCLSELLKVRYAFVGKLLSEDEATTVAVWGNGNWIENFQYSLSGTPCDNVVNQEQKVCFYTSNIQTQFPTDTLLEEMGVESYMGIPLRDIDGGTLGILVVMDDKPMTEIVLFQRVMEVFANRASSELSRREVIKELQVLSRAVEASSSVVIITNTDGNIEYVNPKFTDITGYTKQNVMGKNPSILNSGETPENDYADMWETISSGGEWKGEFHNRKKDGSLYWARASISSVKDENNKITHFVGIQEDATQEYEMAEQLSFQVSHDALTGLINRSEFERRANRLLLTIHEDNDEHALCYMDLDQFKVVNDTCGHVAGDELLRQLSPIIQSVVRKRDTLARLGGDEFGVLMEHCSLDDAHRVADSLLKVIQDYQFTWEEKSFRIGVSIGLVTITEGTSSLTELLKQADAACYMAKDLGRNRIHVYHEEDTSLSQRHGEMKWVTRIQKALEEDRFCLYAQSIVPLDSRTEVHYELLLRMVDENGKIIPPGAFLPAAERYNLMTKLDNWVIENTFRILKNNVAFLKQIHSISINLSGQSLADESFQDFVIDQFETEKIPPGKICFEITETAAISNLNMAKLFISKMKLLGCRFALDDFGSGLSSFGYLKNLPVDYLKIDGMFVKGIVDDPIDRAMVKSIYEIGHVIGMKTIAEFVENDEIKAKLREIGVDYAQGYGIDKPMAFDELLGRSSNTTDINNPGKMGTIL